MYISVKISLLLVSSAHKFDHQEKVSFYTLNPFEVVEFWSNKNVGKSDFFGEGGGGCFSLYVNFMLQWPGAEPSLGLTTMSAMDKCNVNAELGEHQ